MTSTLFDNIARLSTKLRIYRAVQIADSEAGDLKDRDILILELLQTQGTMNMTELAQFFPGVKASTLSTDIKRLRTEMDLIDMQVDKNDMRVHLIDLSEKGRAKIAEIKTQRANSYIPLAQAIGNDPEEIKLLNKVVKRAIDLVDQEIKAFAESDNR